MQVDIFSRDLSSYIDYTLIEPCSTIKDVEKCCNIAFKYKYRAICISPVNVYYARKYIENELKAEIPIAVVVGFPLGENLTETKVFETKKAIADGADEIDVVISISRVKNNDFNYVKNELLRIRRIARKKIVKAIIETTFLSRDEITKVVKICLRCKVDFIQTSTGYAGGGATPEVIELLYELTRGKCKIKAAGGITSKEEANDLIRKGAACIGTSRKL